MAGWNIITVWALDNIFGYQSANKLRENLIALASLGFVYPLGGSRTTGVTGAGAQTAVEYEDAVIDGTNQSGFTIVALIDAKTANAATSITPYIYNVSDSTTVATGSASTSVTWARQSINLTGLLASGEKTYRLMFTNSDGSNATFAKGYLKLSATA